MNDLFSVRDKIVLITGSTRGLGYHLAQGFVEAGAIVVVNGTKQDGVDAATKKLSGSLSGKHQTCVAGYAFDVTDTKAVTVAIEKIEKEQGPIDVLVNNAGIHRRKPLEQMSLDDWNAVITTNLTAAFVTAQAVAKKMIMRGRGAIINITSLNAEMARPSIGNYCAAKGGLKMLTKSMATEWGKYGIRANAIGPGYFQTELTKVLQDDPEFDAWVKREVPLGRWGKPEELAGAAIFLSSEAAAYVNGHTLYVDGGWQASL
ncbi:MAG: SDR family oxidoreductase [Spirochaetaceae bacterium]|nr:MAG: SDR family oxidoreductase [Spirochaetaceae bacterium]